MNHDLSYDDNLSSLVSQISLPRDRDFGGKELFARNFVGAHLPSSTLLLLLIINILITCC